MITTWRVVTHSDSAEQNEWKQLEKDPRFAVFHVKQDGMFIAVRINRADYEGGNQSAKKWAPQSFHGKIVADLDGEHKIFRIQGEKIFE